MHIPRSTYRVQLNRDFTLKDLSGIVDYLHRLGVSTIYAAPIVTATPGSMHGYDVTDPHMINPEIGTLQELRSLRKKLRERQMSWIQDIVPNHMAFSVENFRLMDVLERGPQSPFYNYFDIDWQHPSPRLTGKLQVPFLGSEPEECLGRREITIGFTEKGFTVDYQDTSWPLSLPAYEYLFGCSENRLFACQDFVSMGERARDYNDWKSDKESYLAAVFNDEPALLPIRSFLESFNSEPGKIRQLLELQYYRLAWWRDTGREINYRRFFTVNELICLRMEDETVFNEYHRFVHALYKDDLIQGLRIDHIDGLKDPATYIRRLRALFGESCYIIAEKILESGEDIPEQWPLEGTSGYEFLSHVSQLMTDRRGAGQMVAFYRQLVPDLPPYHELVVRNKKLILEKYMAGEWENLARYFHSQELSVGHSMERMRHALGVFMISLPVYRIYPARIPVKGEALARINEAFAQAVMVAPDHKAELDHLCSLLTSPPGDEKRADRILAFFRRVMQFTGPLTAKGVEDTTFYIYNALISHDEVGDAPSQLGISIASFHRRMVERQKSSPLSLNATATHDTKRGEDARLRLNLLCELPGEWKALVSQWFAANGPCREVLNGRVAPTPNDEYYIYQAILGGFPDDLTITDAWVERLVAYEVKVLREAKMNSDWSDPDEMYEESCVRFIRKILERASPFLQDLLPFLRTLLDRAHQYALAQVLIKATAPGIPDTYQGCELWDLSFVDPDNRRAVNYILRQEFLDEIIERERRGPDELFCFLKNNRNSGMEKLFTTWKALTFRMDHPDLFARGEYLPLECRGQGPATIAFARHSGSEWIVVVVLLQDGTGDRSSRHTVALPAGSAVTWLNVIAGEKITGAGELGIGDLCGPFPFALLYGKSGGDDFS